MTPSTFTNGSTTDAVTKRGRTRPAPRAPARRGTAAAWSWIECRRRAVDERTPRLVARRRREAPVDDAELVLVVPDAERHVCGCAANLAGRIRRRTEHLRVSGPSPPGTSAAKNLTVLSYAAGTPSRRPRHPPAATHLHQR